MQRNPQLLMYRRLVKSRIRTFSPTAINASQASCNCLRALRVDPSRDADGRRFVDFFAFQFQHVVPYDPDCYDAGGAVNFRRICWASSINAN